MINQTYQEVSKVILEELVKNPVDFKEVNYQIYFHDLKLKCPEKYEALRFDINGHEPFSKELSGIFIDFKICGFTDYEGNILSDTKEEIIAYLNKKE